MNKAEARNINGGLQQNSKMPCRSLAIECRGAVAQRLRSKAGTVCGGCYGRKRLHHLRGVKLAQVKKADAINDPRWVEAMTIDIKSDPFFRWLSNGELTSVTMLDKILAVCRETPETRHWLPTREMPIIRQRRSEILGLDNLTVRLSANMVNGPPPSKAWPLTSTVVTDSSNATCPAPQQGHQCHSCRLCWDKAQPNIAYTLQ